MAKKDISQITVKTGPHQVQFIIRRMAGEHYAALTGVTVFILFLGGLAWYVLEVQPDDIGFLK